MPSYLWQAGVWGYAMTDAMTEAQKQADSIGSYNDAILKMRCEFLSNRLEIAIKALLDIKRTTQDNKGRRVQQAFIIARDALIQLERNPEPLKRG
jgi:hypothetical protein